MTETQNELKNILEAALLASESALTLSTLQSLFHGDAVPERGDIEQALSALETDCEGRAVELRKVGKGYRYYTRDTYAPWLRKLRASKPPRYSRALLETISIIAYRQPVSRGDIEEIRGVAVSTDIMRLLLDRDWIKQVGYRDVPGRPALYATTQSFLEYFGLSSLKELPELMAKREMTEIATELNLELPTPSDSDSTQTEIDESSESDGADSSNSDSSSDDEDIEAVELEAVDSLDHAEAENGADTDAVTDTDSATHSSVSDIVENASEGKTAKSSRP